MDADPPAKKLKKSTAVEVKVTPQRNFVILEHKVNLMEALESGKATLVKDTKFRMTGSRSTFSTRTSRYTSVPWLPR